MKIFDRVFSVQSDNELYFGDVFVGYILHQSHMIVKLLNYDHFNDDIDWSVDDKFLWARGAKMVDIRNGNFNQQIVNKLNYIPYFKEEWNYFTIESKVDNIKTYNNILLSDFKETVKNLIHDKQYRLRNFPELKFEYKIKPLLI